MNESLTIFSLNLSFILRTMFFKLLVSFLLHMQLSYILLMYVVIRFHNISLNCCCSHFFLFFGLCHYPNNYFSFYIIDTIYKLFVAYAHKLFPTKGTSLFHLGSILVFCFFIHRLLAWHSCLFLLVFTSNMELIFEISLPSFLCL